MSKNAKLTGWISIIICLSLPASGQEYLSLFKVNERLQASDSNKLFLFVRNTDFFKNNEYFNEIYEGYTLPGFNIETGLTYYPTSRARISGGVHLLKYSGKKSFNQVVPVVSAQIEITPDLDFVIGTLYGTANHNMAEPLYAMERVLSNPVENGLQFLYHGSRIHADVWLNWERFIEPRDTFQEMLSQGISSEFFILPPSGKFVLSVPLQTVAVHHGGQINNSASHMQTLLNALTGLKLSFHPETGLVSKWSFETLYMVFHDHSPEKTLPFHNGFGIYPSVSAAGRYFFFSAGYWYASDFIAPAGEPLMQSISFMNPEYTEPVRQQLIGKLCIENEAGKPVRWGVRFEPYYDLKHVYLDYSYSVFVIFNHDFFLKKTK